MFKIVYSFNKQQEKYFFQVRNQQLTVEKFLDIISFKNEKCLGLLSLDFRYR